jgi:hypothetical protein
MAMADDAEEHVIGTSLADFPVFEKFGARWSHAEKTANATTLRTLVHAAQNPRFYVRVSPPEEVSDDDESYSHLSDYLVLDPLCVQPGSQKWPASSPAAAAQLAQPPTVSLMFCPPLPPRPIAARTPPTSPPTRASFAPAASSPKTARA